MYGATGPSWTQGDMEAPMGEKDMGTWTAAVYTPEQQVRLGVDEEGNPANQTGPSSTGFKETFTKVDVKARAAAAKSARARTRWKVAGAVAKAVVGMPMAVGIPVTHVPHDAVWAPAIEVPVAMPICATTGTLQIPTEDKMAIVKRRLGSLPPSVFSTLDKNGDGYLTPDELREGFEVMGDPLPEAELKTILSVADTDGDGRVSAAEFEALAATLQEVQQLKEELGFAA